MKKGEVWFVEFPVEEDPSRILNRPVIVLDEKKFNSDFGTEERSYSKIEWIAFMEYCLNHNVLMEKIIGIDYND